MCRTSFHGDDMHVLMGIQWAPESSTGGEGGGIQRGDAEGGGNTHYVTLSERSHQTID